MHRNSSSSSTLSPVQKMSTSRPTSATVQAANHQRRCFLIDSLLEERQKKLAAAAAISKLDSNNSNGTAEALRDSGKQTIPDLQVEKEMVGNEEDGEASEETLPTFDQENDQKQTIEGNDEKEGSERGRKADDVRNDDEEDREGEQELQRKALLETLAKLVNEENGEGNRVEDGTGDEQNERTEAEGQKQQRNAKQDQNIQQQQHQQMMMPLCPSATAPMDFLQRVRLFQQFSHQFAPTSSSNHSAEQRWPFQCPHQATLPASFIRSPFLPSSFFSLMFNNGLGTSPSTEVTNPATIPTSSTETTDSGCNKMKNCQIAKGDMKRTAVAGNALDNFWSSAAPFLNARNGQSSSTAAAVLASIGAFRAAAVAAAYANANHNNENSGTINQHFVGETGTSKRDDPRETIHPKRSKLNNGSVNLRKQSHNKHNHQQSHQHRVLPHHGRTGIGSTSSSRSSNVKKYRCDICEKTFSRSNTLITHKRIHTGEKPFRCEHCGRAFRQPGNLTRHAYTHTTVKPFVCAECGKAFNRASNLQSHVRVHSIGGAGGGQLQQQQHEAVPHKCKQCQHHFGTRSELRAHKC